MPDYSDPKLRERLKAKIQESDKGGKPGQWSARKAQLLAQAYKREGGTYRGGKGGEQKNLDRWGKEKWTTADGGRARRSGGTTRYLPKKAWDALSDEEKKATQKAKQAGSKKGDQFVANTPAAKRARKKITKATKKKAKPAKKTAAKKKKTTASKKKTATGASKKKRAKKTKSKRAGGRKKKS